MFSVQFSKYKINSHLESSHYIKHFKKKFFEKKIFRLNLYVPLYSYANLKGYTLYTAKTTRTTSI